jgi:hypothetical protein
VYKLLHGIMVYNYSLIQSALNDENHFNKIIVKLRSINTIFPFCSAINSLSHPLNLHVIINFSLSIFVLTFFYFFPILVAVTPLVIFIFIGFIAIVCLLVLTLISASQSLFSPFRSYCCLPSIQAF